MRRQFPDWKTSGSLIAVLCVTALSTGCVSDDPLLSSVSLSGGGTSAPVGDDDSESNVAETSANGAGDSVSSAACLVGSWDVDKPSYLALFGAGAEGLGGSLAVDGLATVDFTETTLTSTYSDWTVTGQSPDGEIALVMNGAETSGWSVSEDNLLTLDNPESTIVSTLTVSAGGQSMVLPAGNDVESVNLANFTVACDADQATFSGSEGFLVLTRK